MQHTSHHRGRLIVIDGTDGSGKATQVRLLRERLARDGVRVQAIDFPQYRENHFGRLIRECLDGKHGDFLSVSPRIASVLYAADRWECSQKIARWLDDGYTVIADRYVSANQIHQGAKIHDEEARREFLAWLDRMEYDTFKIPRPDAVFFLDVPTRISSVLLVKKSAEVSKWDSSTKGAVDLAESDAAHQEHARESALRLIAEGNVWHRIECVAGDTLLPAEIIAERVYAQV